MFEVGWLELLVIAVVLIVVVGPKDLPGMLRTFGRVTSQLRRMAGDFRKQFDDALREAELDEVRKAAGDLKKLDPRDDIRKAMNPMKAVGDEIRSSLKAATEAPQPKVPSADAGARPMDESANPVAMPAQAALPEERGAVGAGRPAADGNAAPPAATGDAPVSGGAGENAMGSGAGTAPAVAADAPAGPEQARRNAGEIA